MVQVSDRKQHGSLEFFTVEIDGIIIKDCKLLNGSKGKFVTGPSVPMLDKDKTLMLDENGKGRYKNPITFSDDVQKEIMAALDGDQVDPVANDDTIPF